MYDSPNFISLYNLLTLDLSFYLFVVVLGIRIISEYFMWYEVFYALIYYILEIIPYLIDALTVACSSYKFIA